MACTTTPNPSRTKRTVLAMGLEKRTESGSNVTVCTRNGGLEQVILYENFNPVSVQSNIIAMNRAKNSIGPEAVVVGVTTYQLSGTVYMHGSGYVNVEPNWSKLLRASGFKVTRKIPSSGGVTLTDGTDVIFTSYDGSYVPTTDQIGLDVAATYKYKFTITKSFSGTPKEGPFSNEITKTLSAGHDSFKIDFEPAFDVGGDFEGGTYLNIYRTEGGGSTHYRVATVLVDDLQDGVHSQDGATAWEYYDNLHDSDLAEAAPTAAASGDDSVIWTPYNEDHDSISVASYLDHAKYLATGVRGSVEFSAEAGNPFGGNFTLQGVYNDPDYTASNPALLSNPGVPPRLENTFCVIQTDSGEITPIPKSIGLGLTANINPRPSTNAPTAVLEYIIGSFTPVVRMQVEANSTHEWVKWFRANKKFRIKFYLSPDNDATDASDLVTNGSKGQRILIVAGGGDEGLGSPDAADIYCQLQSEPTFDDNNESRVLNLEFIPASKDITNTSVTADNFVLLRQF